MYCLYVEHSNNFIVLYLSLSLLHNRGIHNVYNILAHVPAIDFQKESVFDMWSTVGE
jgi:hypothetical protein